MSTIKIFDDTTAYTIANQALPFWDLAEPQIDLISRSENIVFRVDTPPEQRHVLRIHRPGYHTLDELNAEQEWTAALNKSGVSVPVAIKTHDGRGYVPISLPLVKDQAEDQAENQAKSVCYVGMVEWFDGASLGLALKGESNAETLTHYFQQVGQIAARIHNQSAEWVSPSAGKRHELDADGLAGDSPFWGRFWDLPQLGDRDRHRLSDIRLAVHQKLTALGKDPQHYSLIHADLHPGNLLIKDDILHVIDFDDCGYSWHIYELAVSLFYSMNRPDFSLLQAAMITGYRTQRALSAEMVALLPFFLLIRSLSLIGWTHERPELGISERIPKLVANVFEQADLIGL